jgi:hypothetical protein
MAHDPEMEVMHARVTQLERENARLRARLERENARLRARLEDRERELRWLLELVSQRRNE